MSEFTDSNKERFTETEVKDWINELIADQNAEFKVEGRSYFDHNI